MSGKTTDHSWEALLNKQQNSECKFEQESVKITSKLLRFPSIAYEIRSIGNNKETKQIGVNK